MERVIAKNRATQLVEKMTVEEMASQLRFDAPAIERLNIPAYNWWNEGLHGVARAGTATVFPQAIGLGATFDKDLVKRIGDAIATEARAKYNEFTKYEDRDIYKGLTLWSPNLNLFRDPRWGRGHETYGEDPHLIGRLGISFIQGLQGNGEYLKTAACAKHFAVHSGPEELRHHFDAKASIKDMWETYLPAFEECVVEGEVEAVMGAYNRTNGEPCCAHSYLMDEVLRGKWKFEGHYVSDCWALKDFHEQHKVTNDANETIVLALEKGCDLNCGCTYEKIITTYNMGLLPKEYIKRAAIRVFTTRFLLGMFDKTEYDDIPYEVVECKEHLQLAAEATQKSAVLLKNNGILPLCKEKIKTIGVIGPNANSRAALVGNYHGTSSRYITILEGIQDYVGDDIRVLYTNGSHLFQDREEPLAQEDDRLSEAKTVANHSDLVVLCLGLDETLEGEEGDTGNAYASGDKKDLQLPLAQRKLLDTIIETKVPFIVLMMAGSAIDLKKADEKADAILQVWYPGARGGKEIARMLFGEISPSGKLPITLYYDLEHMPDFTDYSMKGRTYRFVEHEPLYPFGYGLNYGEVCIHSATCSSSYAQAIKEGVLVEIQLENKRQMEIEEVVQIYTYVQSEYEVKNPKLSSFQRVHLKPYEKKTIEMFVENKMFGVINERGERVYDGTCAKVYVGFGQPDRRTEQLMQRKGIEIVLN